MSALYRIAISLGDRIVPQSLTPLWQYPTGPKTVFFWAPLCKWGLVFAGIGDLQRSADQLSISQSSALVITGIIWSRYSLVIYPKSYGLFSVNFFVAVTNSFQLFRAIRYQHLSKSKAIEEKST